MQFRQVLFKSLVSDEVLRDAGTQAYLQGLLDAVKDFTERLKPSVGEGSWDRHEEVGFVEGRDLRGDTVTSEKGWQSQVSSTAL